ncbi:MAG: DUF2911 domain-containing protein [Chitinophagaceae bacterium]|nr:DUF2911 domain-containing protein [Chitinophagaceae bacterium]
MKTFISIALLALSLQASAQTNSAKLPSIDKSPMDISYYPTNYPLLKIQDKVTEPLVMRLIYSRPQLNGRRAFGELRELGKIWRLGANEATEIEFFKDAKIEGKKLKKGRYTLYSIPNADMWTIIVNKETDTWGDFKYDQSKDIIRVAVPAVKNEIIEAHTMIFEKSSGGANLLIYWDDVTVALPISF